MKKQTTVVFGVAVKHGKFRANRITYNSRGVSTIEPLTDWTDADSAVKAKEDARAAYTSSQAGA